MSSVKDFDFYRGRRDPTERMAVLRGTGLPAHVDPVDWEQEPMRPGIEEAAVVDDVAEDIEDHGFAFYRLVAR